MADHSQPTLTSNYTDVLTLLHDRIDDIAAGMDPVNVSPTNIPDNAIRWSSAQKKWQYWNGSVWGDLASSYAISITGNSATASVAEKLETARTVTLSGDASGSMSFDGSADKTLSVTLAESGVTAGTYTSVTVDEKGRVTEGSSPEIDYEEKDEDQLLRDWTNALIAGTAPGSEVAWGVNDVWSATLESTLFAQTNWGELSTGLLGLGISTKGKSSYIYEKYHGYITGDSGQVYQFIHTTLVGIWLHPKHGDVQDDFTAGNTYVMISCQESGDTLYTDSLPVTEHFMGTGIDTVSEIESIIGTAPVAGAIVTPGVWQGTDFVDVRPDGVRTVFYLSRKATVEPDSVMVDGAAATYTWDDTTNEVTLASAPAATSYVTVVYNTLPRRFRPAANPTGVRAIGALWAGSTYNTQFGSHLAAELVEFVPTSYVKSFFRPDSYALSSSWGVLSGSVYIPSDVIVARCPSSAKSAVVALFGLQKNSTTGTYCIIAWFKQLLYDTDWGDDGILPINDYVTTTTDDNGNVILSGCMSYDTGVEYYDA